MFLLIFFLERKRGGGKEKEGERNLCERETSTCPLQHAPQPGIQLSTFQCTGWCSSQLTHPARVWVILSKENINAGSTTGEWIHGKIEFNGFIIFS